MSAEQGKEGLKEAGHSDLAKIVEGVKEEFGGDIPYLQTETEPVEPKRFSKESREALEKQGFVIYELTGQSIASEKAQNRKFWTEWHRNGPQFEALTSMQSEVAINPNQPFIPKSNKKTFAEQEEMIDEFSQELGEKVTGVKAIMGGSPDYVDLAFTHLDATGKFLFGEKDDFGFARTNTSTVGANVANVGYFDPVNGLGVRDLGGDWGVDYIFASPLVVPA